LLRHLRRHGCVLRREGKEHSLWENPQTGHAEAVPRHAEISNLLSRRICRNPALPDPPGWKPARRLHYSLPAPHAAQNLALGVRSGFPHDAHGFP